MKIDSIIDIFDERTVAKIILRVLKNIQMDEKNPLDCTLQYLVDCVMEILPEVEEKHKSTEFVMNKALMRNMDMFKVILEK